MESIALTIVPQMEAKERGTVHYNNSDGLTVLIRGSEASAPNLCCGNCGAVLVQGVSQFRFVRAEVATAAGMKAIKFTPQNTGPLIISGTLPINSPSDRIDAVLLCCPTCKVLNETAGATAIQ